MYAELLKLSDCLLTMPDQCAIAVYEGRKIRAEQFRASVKRLAALLKIQDEQDYAVFYEQAYPFAVAVFALLHAGKRAWLPGNNKKATAECLIRQGCALLGEWQASTPVLSASESPDYPLQVLNPQTAQIVIFTSGSSGRPKSIGKALWQLQCEVEVLERQWGGLLGSSEVLATVGHQHIYGFIFRVLWPLLSGRCFHSTLYLSPEPLLTRDEKICWIASPAQLKRLDELTAWPAITQMTAIFSSGGLLAPEAAAQIKHCSGCDVIEVYGSSETGGIGWRRQLQERTWQPFAGMILTVDEGGRGQLQSPYLPEPVCLDDKLIVYPDQRFALLGRLDRIVKVEEKRLSLDELERTLSQLPWVSEAWTLLLTNGRDKIAAVVALTSAGFELLHRQGKAQLIRQLRTQLMNTFETVVLPRKWLFTGQLPMTVQGKLNTDCLRTLLQQDHQKFPQILYYRGCGNKIELAVRIVPNLKYFIGHFPGYPILPGVTQLFWAEYFGKLFFDISAPFLHMEAIKFKKIIQPEAQIAITLEWRPETGKLYFDFSSATDAHSAGRLVYGVEA